MRYRLINYHCARLFLGLITTLLLAISTQATTAIMMTDEDLIVSSRAIVKGQVTKIESQYGENGNIFTYITVDVEHVYKGQIAEKTIVIRQLGGRMGDRVAQVYGSPQFVKGEKVLLYLNTANDGALHVAHLFIGKFQIIKDDNGKRLVKRTIDGEVNFIKNQTTGTITNEMALNSYIAKIQDTLFSHIEETKKFDKLYEGKPLLAIPLEYRASAKPRELQSQFVLTSTPVRWFESDNGTPISYKLNTANAPINSGGASEINAGLASWTNIASCKIILQNSGASSSCGFAADNVNVISFDDCLGQIADPTNCGGVLAVTQSTFTTSQNTTVNGTTFGRLLEADIVFNNNFQCFLSNSANLAEVATHEIGHSIGLGHSSVSQATMFPSAHGDGRGATLNQDDIDGASFIYPNSAAPPDNIPPVVKVTSPNGGEKLDTGKVFNITWTTSDNVGATKHDITLSTDGGTTFPVTVASGLSGTAQSFNWTVPAMTTSNARIRVMATDGANNQGTDVSDANFVISPPAGFNLSVNPTTQSIIAGDSSTLTLAVQGLGGFSQAVNLSTSFSPGANGLTATLSTATATPNPSANVMVQIATTTDLQPGTYTLTITGTSGQITATTKATINVGGFNLSITPGSQAVTPGKSVTYSISSTVFGNFSQAIDLNLLVAPANSGLTATLSTNSLKPNNPVTLTVNTTDTTTPTNYVFTITGSAGQLTRTVTAALNVRDFAIEASPATQSVKPGSAVTFTINARALGNFTQTINLTTAISPSESTISANLSSPVVVPGGNVTLTVNTTNNTPIKDFTLTITGTASQVVHTTTLTLNVAPANDFTLTANPGSQMIRPGNSFDFTVNSSATGSFADMIGLTAEVSPANSNVIVALSSPTVAAGGQITVKCNIANQTPVSNFEIRITGTAAGLTRRANISVQVPNVAPKLMAIADQNVQAGSTTKLMVMASDDNGPNGLILALVSGPKFVSFTDKTNGQGELVIAPLAGDTGGTVTLNVIDPSGANSQITFNITVISLQITNASYQKKVLVINGAGFGTTGALINVNGRDVSTFKITQADSVLMLKANKKKLNIKKGANVVTVTANGTTSAPFTFTFFSANELDEE